MADQTNVDSKKKNTNKLPFYILGFLIFAGILIIGGYFLFVDDDSTDAGSTGGGSGENNINTLAMNPYIEAGDPFGAGFAQIEDLEINKSMSDVNTICYPKCLNNTDCAGFGYNISDRFDKRTNGNCWFMKKPFAHASLTNKTPGVGGVWIKK
jgi:hypothetical protein